MTKRAPRSKSQSRRPAARRQRTAPGALSVEEIDDLRAELARLKAPVTPSRWNAGPDDARRSMAKLVLTLVDFIRQVLERQAIRRHEAGTLTPDQTEAVGMALMRLEETVAEIAALFELDPADLNLDLGPLGRLQ